MQKVKFIPTPGVWVGYPSTRPDLEHLSRVLVDQALLEPTK